MCCRKGGGVIMFKMASGFSCTELHLVTFCPLRVALSDSSHKSDICILSEKLL